MMISRGLWEFLTDPTNRTVLGWLGGGLVTTLGGGWAVLQFLSARADRASRAAPVAPPPAIDTAALVENIVDKFLADRRGAPEPTLMAPGLAVGYYFNFLDIIAQELEAGTVRIRQSADPDGSASDVDFDLSNSNIQIILPARFTAESFRHCEDEFRQSLRGFLFLQRVNRYYGVNYRIFEIGDSRRLTIVDLARPAMALMRFYTEGPDYLDTKWEDRQHLELAAFEKTLLTLQARNHGALANKLDIIRRG